MIEAGPCRPVDSSEVNGLEGCYQEHWLLRVTGHSSDKMLPALAELLHRWLRRSLQSNLCIAYLEGRMATAH